MIKKYQQIKNKTKFRILASEFLGTTPESLHNWLGKKFLAIPKNVQHKTVEDALDRYLAKQKEDEANELLTTKKYFGK